MPETEYNRYCGLRTRVSSSSPDLGDRFYSPDLTLVFRDSTSQHVLQADEAIGLGAIGQEGGNPYLNIEKLVNVALTAQADAIHPGYGYLSENANFADAVRQAGLAFIGPSSNAMSTLGDKRSAKAYLREHDPSIPLIPGVASSVSNQMSWRNLRPRLDIL